MSSLSLYIGMYIRRAYSSSRMVVMVVELEWAETRDARPGPQPRVQTDNRQTRPSQGSASSMGTKQYLYLGLTLKWVAGGARQQAVAELRGLDVSLNTYHESTCVPRHGRY